MRREVEPTGDLGCCGALGDELGDLLLAALVAAAGPGSGSRLVTVELRQLGGALARPATDGGALPAIDASFALLAGGPVEHPDAALAADLERITDASRPWDTGRRYMNFAEGPDDPSAMFPPSTYQRLRRVKALVDPGEVIRANHQIPPLS